MPLTRFAGFSHCPRQWLIPMPIALVQTCGSFYKRTRSRSIIAHLDLPTGREYKYTQQLPTPVSSIEAEWASVYYGLAMAQQLEQSIIGLENNCLGVVQAILSNSPGKHEYAKYYNYKIHRLGREAEWCGIRWMR